MKTDMQKDSYSYDVAISCQQGDLAFAQQLASRLSAHLRVFLYSECQDELAGGDGINKFSEVFRESSRLVVILYGNGWGKTRWTRVEETAIKERFLDEGADFVFMVRRDSTTLPVWFPRTHIYAESTIMQLDEIVDAIRNSARRLGCCESYHTAEDYARQAQRNAELARRREQLLHSAEGVLAARSLVNSLFEKVHGSFGDVSGNFSENQLVLAADAEMLVLRSVSNSPVSAVLQWKASSCNSISGASLELNSVKGSVFARSEGGSRIYILERPTRLGSRIFFPFLESEGKWIWKEQGYEPQMLSNGELSTLFYKTFFSLIEKVSSGELRFDFISASSRNELTRI